MTGYLLMLLLLMLIVNSFYFVLADKWWTWESIIGQHRDISGEKDGKGVKVTRWQEQVESRGFPNHGE